ncbi:hypothetical protein K523DRAFT_358968 [Schizophyllum commune Tattone D]|nr:hypothetical protein K523DRAFT_358968 [Schizophyllum commune Tattone D]
MSLPRVCKGVGYIIRVGKLVEGVRACLRRFRDPRKWLDMGSFGIDHDGPDSSSQDLAVLGIAPSTLPPVSQA